MDDAWRDGRLEILGFRDDFEMRVMRSTEPETALDELSQLVPPGVTRIGVDPGSMFLGGGVRTLVGRTFLDWASRQPATVWATLSVEGTGSLPSSAEWLVQSTSGVILIERRTDGLYQARMNRAVPSANGVEESVTLQLDPGTGLTAPEKFPSRRRSDRPLGDPNQLLLVSLGKEAASEMQAWAKSVFETQVVTQSLDAVAHLQGGAAFGGVLVHASRAQIREAVQVSRAIRPLTAAAIVVASDDAIRSTDRVALLEAGADDCLSGGVDFRELTTRIQQAVEAGGKAVASRGALAAEPEPPKGGPVTMQELLKEVDLRAGKPLQAVFSLVRLGAPEMGQAKLAEALEDAIRGEEGDLVAPGSHGECMVLLQGARRDPANAFLKRFTGILAKQLGRDPAIRSEILSHPAEGDLIGEFMAGSGGVGGDVTDHSTGGSGGPSA
jgi:DNA-binding response OmpR family regulator